MSFGRKSYAIVPMIETDARFYEYLPIRSVINSYPPKPARGVLVDGMEAVVNRKSRASQAATLSGR